MSGTRSLHVFLLLAAIGLVVWIRLLPLSLAGVETRARQTAARGSPGPPAGLDAPRSDAVARLKADFTYPGPDGRQHVYLGDYDSYLWLRNARQYLRTGTTCDSIRDGECRDMRTHAPVGVRARYARSLHIAAIVVLHRALTALLPDFPLPSTAYLVPVLVGALGVLPAFAVGRRLAGGIGGLAAAVVVGVNPLFLRRSLGSDNDVWNVVLPLFMVWAILAAFDAQSTPRRLAWTSLAAFLAALHAATWRGWVFTYGVVLGGLLAHLAFRLVEVVSGRRRGEAVREAALMAAVFYIGAGLFTTLAQDERNYWTLPADLLAALLPAATNAAPGAGETVTWPTAFGTVAELSTPNLSSIAAEMGGRVVFFIGWLGLLVLLLPAARWRWWHFVLLIGGNYLYRHLLTTAGLGRPVLLALLALPLVAALLLALLPDRDESLGGAGLLIALWFLAALFLAYNGTRYVMLLAPPFGLVFAVALGRLHAWLDAWITRRAAALGLTATRIARPLLLAACAAVLIAPIRLAHAAATSYLPRINDAWWEALAFIREETPSEAIVNSWWDFGYWIQYITERRVSADGASLATHIPHWVGRALVAPNEHESAGLLRMLNCGSDATPEPEGREGAYGKLTALGIDPVEAHGLIVELARLDRNRARLLLARRGLSEDQAADVLASTHCEPPPSYLVLTTALIPVPGWRILGNWDPERAYAVELARTRSEPEAEAALAGLGMTESEAGVLFREARAALSRGEAERFVSPSAGYLHAGWIPCRRETGGGLACSAGLRIDREGTVLRTVVFRPEVPGSSPLRVQRRGGPASGEQGAPALLLVADDSRLEEVEFPAPTHPDLAVLIDVPNERVLLGPPYLLRSTFTRLQFLDGRQSRLFRKFDERTAYGGERVTTWEIDWDNLEKDAEPDQPPSSISSQARTSAAAASGRASPRMRSEAAA